MSAHTNIARAAIAGPTTPTVATVAPKPALVLDGEPIAVFAEGLPAAVVNAAVCEVLRVISVLSVVSELELEVVIVPDTLAEVAEEAAPPPPPTIPLNTPAASSTS